MRRRAADDRRRVRRRLSILIWVFLAGFITFIFLQHNNNNDQHQRYVQHPVLERNSRNIQVTHNRLNLTKEIASANSYVRQLLEQMTLAKSYVVIAKEHNNLNLAWKLSSTIRNCQFLLSKAAM